MISIAKHGMFWTSQFHEFFQTAVFCLICRLKGKQQPNPYASGQPAYTKQQQQQLKE